MSLYHKYILKIISRITNHGSSITLSASHITNHESRITHRVSRFTSPSGFSLIELIVGVMIMGIAFVGAMLAHSNIQATSVRVEATFRSTSLANNVMGIVRSKNYDENTGSPWSTVLGAEESSSTEYDDVDDYNGHDWSFLGVGFPGYNISTRIFYVNPAVNWMDSTATVTNFKRIIVTVTHAALKSPTVLSSLTTPHGGVTGDETGLGGPPAPPPGF